MRLAKTDSCPARASGLALFERLGLVLLLLLLGSPLACSSSTPSSTTTVAVTGVSLDHPTLSLATGGAAATLTATVNPSNATNKAVTWTTSNAAVATVSSGMVTAVGAGSATITVTTVDGAKTAGCAVAVAAPTVSVSGVSLDQSTLSLAAGVATSTLTAMVSPANATNKSVSWSTSDAAVAAVTDGVVTPVGVGSAMITVTTVDGAKTATCAVTVAAAPGPQLIAIGNLDGATDLSGLSGTLENGDPASVLGGLGSGMAWAGGNTFLNVPDRGPNAVPYDASIDNTTAYIARFHTIQMVLMPNPGPGLPYRLTPTLTNTTLLSSADPLSYGTGSSQALTDVLNLNTANGIYYFTGLSDGYGSGDSGNPLNSRLDPEAIRVSNDGQSIFVSDEYGPDVYQFDRATGRRTK